MSFFQKNPDTSPVDSLAPNEAALPDLQASAAATTIPLIEEELLVGKRTVDTGIVRLRKYAEERIETLNVPLTEVSYSVERVPVDRVVAEAPPMRQEGDTTIYPIIEERVVVTRELHLREELRVTRLTTTTHDTSAHTLTREEIVIEREAL